MLIVPLPKRARRALSPRNYLVIPPNIISNFAKLSYFIDRRSLVASSRSSNEALHELISSPPATASRTVPGATNATRSAKYFVFARFEIEIVRRIGGGQAFKDR
jgi:hypothetical protein